ncbi:HD domain-containing protein [Streptomyces phaeofaciens JCM 4814]|uniref:5'-deoxynucleotidase n=1 Tax=Streptomyces phaeofaciens TaxID=68254 RepID=A0A918HR72_9ACTN|nr:HD domain-containing protein [Streptomyces phaeofaciens]GGT99166.1 haloacid dehalogenase [Streptomyces phaeofaciens]
MPEHMPTDAETVATAALLFEAGALRNQTRTGWPYDGVPVAATETVAEHSHRTTVIGVALAAMEGADPARTALLCALHDLHETRIGDQTPVTRRYVTTADPRKVTADQVAGTHPPVGSAVTSAVEEFEAGETVEARCARDADKLDCLYRALEYRTIGYRTDGKIERCRAALKTGSARSLADAATAMDPAQWQRTLLGAPDAH